MVILQDLLLVIVFVLEVNNGIILQWGGMMPNADTTNWRLPVSYTNNQYKIVFNQLNGTTASQANLAVTARSTASFNIFASLQERKYGILWISIGY